MADPLIDPSKANDHPEDFAVIATRMITTDPDKQEKPPVKVVDKAPEKVEKTESKSKIPDGVFEPVKVETKKDEKKIEDASVFDDVKDPELSDKKLSGKHWAELKQKGREVERQAKDNADKAAALEAKIAEYEAKGKDTEALAAKLAEMEKKHGEAMDLVRKVNIELDPEFRRQFVEGRNTLMGQAKTIVEESGGNPQDIETALNLTGKSRVDALGAVAETLNQFQAGRLGRVIDALTELDTTAASKRGNPEEYLKQREAEEHTRTQRDSEERAKIANSAFESAMSRAATESEVLRHVNGLEEWNRDGQEIKTKASEFWRNNRDPEKAARLIIDGFTAPKFRQLFLDQRAENATSLAKIESLEKELKGLYNRGPKISGSSASRNAGPADFAERASGLMNGTIQQ